MEEKSSSTEESEEKSIPYLKTLYYDKQLKLGTPNYKSNIEFDVRKINTREQRKLFDRPACPDDCILVKLASRVYHEKPKGSDLSDIKLPMDWKLLTTAYNTGRNNGYFGAAYWNPKEQRIVVAHRGSKFTTGALWTDIRGILYNNYVPQMASAITFADEIKVMVQELNKRENVFLQLSFTGHSLGGWLAQITTLTTKYFGLKNVNGEDLFVKSSKLGYHAHTVVFDSPGCGEMLLKIKKDFDLRNDINRDTIFISDLDITTYLSAPNLVNTCHSHTGTVYRVFIKYSPSPSFRDFGIYTLKMHSIDRIEEVFTTNKINETKKVMDWPLVDKGIIERAFDILVENMLNATPLTPLDLIAFIAFSIPVIPMRNFISRDVITTMLNLIKPNIAETMPNLLRRQKLFRLEGDKPLPESDEYKYFHLLSKNIGNYNPRPDDRNGFCEIRYQVKDVNKKKCSMSIFSQPELDFLKMYQQFRKQGKKLTDVFMSVDDRVNEIQNTLQYFKMEEKVGIIRCKSEDELKKLIRCVKYIIRFMPKIPDRIKNK